MCDSITGRPRKMSETGSECKWRVSTWDKKEKGGEQTTATEVKDVEPSQSKQYGRRWWWWRTEDYAEEMKTNKGAKRVIMRPITKWSKMKVCVKQDVFYWQWWRHFSSDESYTRLRIRSSMTKNDRDANDDADNADAKFWSNFEKIRKSTKSVQMCILFECLIKNS